MGLKLRVIDLPHWPPPPALSGPERGATVPTGTEEVTVKDVTRVVDSRVDFTGMFGNYKVTYSMKTPDEKTAKKLAKILEDKAGQTLASVGPIELPADEEAAE